MLTTLKSLLTLSSCFLALQSCDLRRRVGIRQRLFPSLIPVQTDPIEMIYPIDNCRSRSLRVQELLREEGETVSVGRRPRGSQHESQSGFDTVAVHLGGLGRWMVIARISDLDLDDAEIGESTQFTNVGRATPKIGIRTGGTQKVVNRQGTPDDGRIVKSVDDRHELVMGIPIQFRSSDLHGKVLYHVADLLRRKWGESRMPGSDEKSILPVENDNAFCADIPTCAQYAGDGLHGRISP